MKRILLFALIAVLLPMFVVAQNKKVALLQTLNGDKSVQVKGIEMNMVRGELRKAISNQPGYQAFTRTDIDQLMREHGFQNSGMVSDAQRKKLGEMSGADYICVSTLTKSESQFYLEAYLIEVETGEISNPASQFGMLEGNTYTNLFQLCQDLAKELITDVGGSSNSTVSSRQSAEQGYVDLGLPSGTLWKAANENGYYDFETAVKIFGSSLPTKEQWEELISCCALKATENGNKLTGDNGNYIILPFEGGRDCSGRVWDVGTNGQYWSSTPVFGKSDYDYAWYYFSWSGGARITNKYACRGYSVRLVHNP